MARDIERRTANCTICGSPELVPLARRSDGMQVLRCTHCGMGVVESIPRDLMALYGSDYYGAGEPGRAGMSQQGYENYAYTAEHGVGWAGALVKLLRPHGGRVLDIGCADGHLLAKLGPGYCLFGIEADLATGRIAAERGVCVLGRDLLDPLLLERHAGSFDVITAIAVLEHLRDIRSGMQTALALLRGDGVLLFEVPLMSAVRSNAVWFNSSLEHVWYPSEPGLRRLIEVELGAQLVGRELWITGYGSTYIGLVFREGADGQAIRRLAAGILTREEEPASGEEAIARMHLHLVHAATATHADVGVLARLEPSTLNPQLLRRFAEQWQDDLWRLKLAEEEGRQLQARARGLTAEGEQAAPYLRLKADLDALEADRVRSHTELTTALVLTQAQLAAARADFSARVAAEGDLGRQRQALDRDLEAAVETKRKATELSTTLEAELAAVRALQSGAAWRVASILQQAARRYPRTGRLVRRVARVLWWTVRGRLISRLRSRQRARSQLGAAAPMPASTVRAGQALSSPVHPRPQSSPGQPIAILEATGHRPPLPAGPEQMRDWPLVSVVVVSFDYGQFVAEAVDSVLAQTFKDLEVIVVEGGSSRPESRLAVAGLRRPRTRVLMQGSSHRAGANRNFGISQARGRYICCLDADDTLAPTYIEKAVYLLERQAYDVVSCAMEKVGADQGQVDILEQPDLAALLENNHVLTCAVFRRSFWERSGGYRDADPAVSGHVHEDWAFWLRLAALGARFRNLANDPLLRYRVHATSLSRGEDVLPMSRQRQIVQQMNQDVLTSVADAIQRSKARASIRYGTPNAPPAPIVLDRTRFGRQPPTLLLAMPFLILGGAERLLSAITADLVQMGWRVILTTSIDPGAGSGDTTPWFERHTSEIFHLPRCLPEDLWEDFLHHLVRSRDVDVLWIVGSAFVYGCLRGLRALHPGLRVADLLFNTAGHTANNRRRRGLIDLIFVENNEVRDWLLARGENSSSICLVKSGVDLDALRPVARSEALIQQIGAAASDLIIGFAGRWSEEKNPLGFVEMARRVDPALPVRFVMTGAGHLRAAIQQAIHEARFPEGRFHLLGEVPDLAPVLGSFDLLVVPSLLDGRPVVVLEALALGVPVLASRVGALPELIREGRTGWLREPSDIQGFVKRIERIGRNPGGLRDMRRSARQDAESRLDVRTMLAAYRTGLASLLPKGKVYGGDGRHDPGPGA